MILKAENLVKKYKTRTVVNNVSVQVAQGEIVGLLGPMVPEKPHHSTWSWGWLNPMKEEFI